MEAATAAAQAIAQSGPIGYALLLTLSLVLGLLGCIMIVSARIIRGAQREMRESLQKDIDDVSKAVAVMRDENNSEFVQLRREMSAAYSDVSTRLGRLEGVAMAGAGVSMRRGDIFGDRKS